MDSVLLLSTGLKVVFALAALALAVLFSRFLDKRIGVDFKDHMTAIETNPIALAVYQGLRWFGICLLLGLVIA